MDKLRYGIIGIGNMGTVHLQSLPDHLAGPDAVLGALCDTDPAKLSAASKKAGPNIPTFNNHKDLLSSGAVDAVIIAVPHYHHVPIALEAFEKGLHVLCEKPLSVTVGQARLLTKTHAEKYSHLKFGIMFQLRTTPVFSKMRQLVADGELGPLTRMTWIATDWFRTHAYYASGGWRATWAGEGGGVLLNQCPHNLDLIGWITGLSPQRVTAVATIAKRHPIEVEDEVSAIIEFSNGAVGHFITTTGEAPGTNRLELAGDRGKLVAEAGRLTFRRTRQSVDEINRTSDKLFPHVETWDIDIPVDRNQPEGSHVILRNFTNAVLRDEPLLSPGQAGLPALELGNAMLLSGITRTPVDFPLDASTYDQLLQDLTKKYAGQKQVQSSGPTKTDMASSFGNKATK